MTYTYDEILNAIKNGTDPAEIAQAFTKDLNDAIRAADEPKPTKYNYACEDLADVWEDLLNAYAAETDESVPEDMYFDADDVREVVPSLIKVYKLTQDYLNGIKNLASVYSNTGLDAKHSVASNGEAETFENLINDLIGK